jgi:hypothetical protein
MFLLLALILVILWAVLFFALHMTAFMIHVILIFAVISLIVHLFSGRKTA